MIEDILVVDKIQAYGPQYELLVSSSTGHGLLSSPNHDRLKNNISIDVFSTDVPFLINVSLISLTPFSPDHPSVMIASQGGLYNASVYEPNISKLSLQCTAIDSIGKTHCTDR